MLITVLTYVFAERCIDQARTVKAQEGECILSMSFLRHADQEFLEHVVFALNGLFPAAFTRV